MNSVYYPSYKILFLLLAFACFYSLSFSFPLAFIFSCAILNFWFISLPAISFGYYGLLLGLDFFWIILFFLRFPEPSAYVLLIPLATILLFSWRKYKLLSRNKRNYLLKIKMENMGFAINEMKSEEAAIKNVISKAREELKNTEKVLSAIEDVLKKFEQQQDTQIITDFLHALFPSFIALQWRNMVTEDESLLFSKSNYYLSTTEERGFSIRILKRDKVLELIFSERVDDILLRQVLLLSDIISLLYENAALLQRLEKLSIYDGLTGVLRRRVLEKKLNNEIARSQKTKVPFSILMLDIDHFKQVNDTYGHLFGDYVLSNAGNIISSIIRKDIDFCGRYGGEEFIIALPNTSCQNAKTVAERIRVIFEKHKFRFKNQEIYITVSIGITQLNSEDNINSLIERADKALYTAKQKGRNRVETNC